MELNCLLKCVALQVCLRPKRTVSILSVSKAGNRSRQRVSVCLHRAHRGQACQVEVSQVRQFQEQKTTNNLRLPHPVCLPFPSKQLKPTGTGSDVSMWLS